MEQTDKEDLHGKLYVKSSNLSPLSLKASVFGKSTARDSSTLRKLSSSKSSRKDHRVSYGSWIRHNKVVFWLLIIAVWAYIGFHVQSQWVHGDHSNKEFISHKSIEENATKGSISENSLAKGKKILAKGKKILASKLGIDLIRKKGRKLSKMLVQPNDEIEETHIEEIPDKNISYGLIVGPFDKIEENVVNQSHVKRKTCVNRKGEFARIVYSQNIILIFHELHTTGLSLSMLELGAEILNCGGSVSAIVLNKKGGLIRELNKRRIKMIKDKGMPSYKTAKKVDLIIAGSIKCSSWIEPYLNHYPAGSGQILWWIIENAREYFNQSKHLLNRVKILTFISETQSKQWLSWCEEEKIKFYFQPMVAPLSVNEELAFVAGIPSSSNASAFSVEKMAGRKDVLRSAVRNKMGLDDNDVLFMSLSSLNPQMGQHLLLEAALLVAEHKVSLKDTNNYKLLEEEKSSLIANQNQSVKPVLLATNKTQKVISTSVNSKKKKKRKERSLRNLLSKVENKHLKILIGSMKASGSKVSYVEEILKFLSKHKDLSKSVLWSPTNHAAALYSAADVYVTNTQGIGETFDMSTVEAMAFSLPVLATDVGENREMVEHRKTGLLHPIGSEATEALARNIQYLITNPAARKQMGNNGRRKVEEKYIKHQAYESLAKVLFKCMRPKSANHWNF